MANPALLSGLGVFIYNSIVLKSFITWEGYTNDHYLLNRKFIFNHGIWIYIADKHHTEETQCVLHTAALPVCSIPSSHTFCLRPLGRSVPHQAKCLCLQILPSGLGIMHPFLTWNLMQFFFSSTYMHDHMEKKKGYACPCGYIRSQLVS